MPRSQTNRRCGILKSDFFDLSVLKVHRRRATKDRNLDLEARTLFIDILNNAVERGERTVGYANLLADLERDRRLRTIDTILNLTKDTLGLEIRNRNRL